MQQSAAPRRIAAFLALDAVGFSKLMEADERAACDALADARAVIDHAIEANGGTILSTAGDSVVAQFTSSTGAVRAALQAQQALSRGSGRLKFRMGVHFGEAVVSGDDLLGDAINIAARLEGLAPPGGIAISAIVADQIAGKVDGRFVHLGRRRAKNVRPLDVWLWPQSAARRARARARLLPLAGGLAAAALVGAAILALDGRQPPPTTIETVPRLAVLPATPIGSAEGVAALAEGLTSELVSQLAISPYIAVDRAAVRGRAAADACSELRRTHGAHFILRTAVRRADDRVRVTTSLVDTGTCEELAAPGPYLADLSQTDALDFELEVARKVAARLGSASGRAFHPAVEERLDRLPAEALTLFECAALYQQFTEDYLHERFRKARDCLLHQVDTEPGSSRAWSLLSRVWLGSSRYNIDPPADWAERAKLAAETALLLDRSNPDAFYARAMLAYATGEDIAIFRENANKVIAANPNDPEKLAALGAWLGYSGEWERGLALMRQAMALDERYPSWYYFPFQLDAYRRGDYQEAIAYGHKVDLPKDALIQTVLAAAYAMNGDRERAEAAIERARAAEPDAFADPLRPFRVRRMPQAIIDHLAEGLARAGVAVEREGEVDQEAARR